MQPRIGRLNFKARPGYFAAVAVLATFEKEPHESQAAGGRGLRRVRGDRVGRLLCHSDRCALRPAFGTPATLPLPVRARGPASATPALADDAAGGAVYP